MKHILIAAIIALLILGGWYTLIHKDTPDAHTHTSTHSDAELRVVTSFYPLQFALERIIGTQGVVINIGAGKDPHDFTPSTQDMLQLQQADVVVLQGADFEPWGVSVMHRLAEDGVPTIIATADLTLHEAAHHDEEHHDDDAQDDPHEAVHTDTAVDEHDDHHDHEAAHTDTNHHHHAHGMYDPHTWLDPVLFGHTVEHLAEALAAQDPNNATTYRTNAAALQAELAVLDTEYQTALTHCAYDAVIASHDAFGYVSERYGFVVHPIAGLSTQDTPSVTVLAALRAEAAEGIGAILLEENSISAYGETLARETGLATLGINPIAYVIPEGDTYLTLMRQNLQTFATALACHE